MKKWYKECPFCKNEIKKEAIKCPFCEELLESKHEWKETNSEISSNSKTYKILIIIMGIVIVLLLAIISFLFINLNNTSEKQNESNIFEKKKMCTEMHNNYEDYLKDTRDWSDDSEGHHYSQYIWDVDLFYNAEYDSCIWVFTLYSNEDKIFSSAYVISDYTNWNKEILWCSTKNDSECYDKRNKKVSELRM